MKTLIPNLNNLYKNLFTSLNVLIVRSKSICHENVMANFILYLILLINYNTCNIVNNFNIKTRKNNLLIRKKSKKKKCIYI